MNKSRYETLTKEDLKAIQLEILSEIDVFCKENSINYYLFAGSLIGAVRHKGYIPWDDDLDICMKREDYKFFFENFNNSSKNYKAICFENTKGYYLASGKVIDNRTIMKEKNTHAFEIGVYVDIFPMDYLPHNWDKLGRQNRKTKIYRDMLILKAVQVSKDREFYKNLVLMLGQAVLKFVPTNYILKKISENAQRYNDDPTCDKIADISVLSYGYNEVFSKNLFDDVEYLEFEGRLLPCPAGYKEVLSNMYGDYMKLPPLEKQVSHHKFKAYRKRNRR